MKVKPKLLAVDAIVAAVSFLAFMYAVLQVLPMQGITVTNVSVEAVAVLTGIFVATTLTVHFAVDAIVERIK